MFYSFLHLNRLSFNPSTIAFVNLTLDICLMLRVTITRSRLITLRPLDGHCHKLYDYLR